MKQTSKIISTYTADVSGVCSALYELGGMVVMHDPSGCNSTYNTHDEPRWYNSDSLVFISGLSEMEAVLGSDEKLINDIVDAATELKPKFIAIAGTPIIMMIGCDLNAVAYEVQAKTGIESFAFNTNGMHSYICGAGDALKQYALKMTNKNVSTLKNSINILGVTPLDFGVNGYAEDMKKSMEYHGFNVISNWAMNSSPEDLQMAGEAEVNLVVSSVGLKTALALKNLFGTPYVIGTPCGEEFTNKIALNIKKAASTKEDSIVFDEYKSDSNADFAIIGEGICARSLAYSLNLEFGISSRVVCPLECEKGILSDNDLLVKTESEIKEKLIDVKTVIADPLYKPIIKNEFISLPHYAFSGRIYKDSMPDNINFIKELLK